jgi:hypothetical protein
VFADRIVRHFALAHHFGGVYGPELDGRLDDKADLLRHLLATEGLDPTGAVEDALADYGVEITRLPVTPSRVFEALRATGRWPRSP